MTTAPDITADDFRAGLRSADKFAEHLVGQPLWPHQRDMVTNPARYRMMCAGRQVGKSRALAIEALHTAYTRPGSLTLLISAGETASLRLLEECAALAMGSPLLSGSVLDDHKKQLTLSTGSRIISVPASQKQIRGWPVDLLIIDEAGFVDNEIWRAAEPAIIARPGSRIILSSSPWGGIDHFFRQLWNRGMTAPDERYASFHWPTSLNPMVSADDLDAIQDREPSHYFNREYLAVRFPPNRRGIDNEEHDAREAEEVRPGVS
ncbi:terminase family protein [Gordonia sp. (in: high G+C Gram-positive bacteria)]|uniref:terminase large subunit domain-containing protein n=1 Tax=Gordonia sp. (in: high G+C Gram-positive bacteria) TaxID=84139 RepID=UPI00257D08B6|nr:terminase family protein [Gordonia sp. (in: high G+C Gram-positive bacteria)]